ncbi:MAG: type I-C CRISPR-associated protein Cas8c/Csd1 [Oscillospiraceae bacterium]|nr:type I-C CRISPR-associated protein Cas8c/Csd1 [Oscillospiraceae bacterium]
MGLLQKAVETYDSHILYAGEYRVGTTMMAPVSHIVTRADIVITINRDGHFMDASAVDKSAPKIVIPATESSGGRTSAPCAHPLCDQIGYLIPGNETKYRLYIDQLSDWAGSEYAHPKLTPILNYVKGGTVLTDLLHCGLVKLDDKGKPENEKQLVCWRVSGEAREECWLDTSLFDSFTRYYAAKNDSARALCMVTGINTSLAGQHPKGIIPINGNAKLISANDSNGFTYRGRFSEEWQAAAVGYEASQKAHNALRWLAQEQGVQAIFGGRTFLCWNPQGKTVTPPTLPFMRPPKPIFQPTDYFEVLKKALESKKAELNLSDGVVLAAFDAATTGRLALTYYNEFQGHDFLQRLHDWDATCCWKHRFFGIQTPTLRQIVDCAFGTQQTEKGIAHMKTDDRVLRQQMQRLISCRVDRAAMSADIVNALVIRASRPMAYKDNVRENILFTACAVIRKYRYDRFKEEWKMALEPEKLDRSYQFGRLLAVMEKVERDTYNGAEDREPNAIRLQSVFCQRPMYASGNLEKQLERAYFPRLHPGSRIRYKNLMGQIMEKISAFPQEEWNNPLEDSYLMGYYLQRSALYAPKNDNMEEKNNECAE